MQTSLVEGAKPCPVQPTAVTSTVIVFPLPHVPGPRGGRLQDPLKCQIVHITCDWRRRIYAADRRAARHNTAKPGAARRGRRIHRCICCTLRKTQRHELFHLVLGVEDGSGGYVALSGTCSNGHAEHTRKWNDSH